MNMELLLLSDIGMEYRTAKSTKKVRYGIYRCYCGNEFKCVMQSIKNGNTKSCGCYNKNCRTTHGLSYHRLYHTWRDMIKRCTNINNKRYKDYGGRGIVVCDRWMNIDNFIEDMDSTFIYGLTLDRIDNNKGYSKDNCRWASDNIQARNTKILRTTNTSGYRGVSFHKIINKFQASIIVNKKQIYLGYFDTAIECAKAYNKYVIDNNLEHTINILDNKDSE